jgi:hypothetical protein
MRENGSPRVGLHLLRDRSHDGNQLIAFLKEGGESMVCDDHCIDQQFQPVARFIQLLQAIAELGDEFGIRSGPMGLPEIRPDGCPRPEELPPYHIRLGPFLVVR